MSFILDALRRAETERERERDHIPGLHTQQLGDPGLDAEALPLAHRKGAPLRVGVGIALVVGLVLVTAAVWLLRPVPAVAPAVLPAVLPASLPAAAPVLPPVAAAPVPAPAPVSTPTQAAPVVMPAARPPAAQPTAAAPPAASVPVRVLALAELPASLRQQMPPLNVGGAMHSSDPAARMLIVNGQVFREGDTVATGVVIEAIQLREAVLVWRGQRFTLPY